MKNDALTRDAVLRIGEVSEIDGLKIYIKVDKNKKAVRSCVWWFSAAVTAGVG